MRKIAIGLLVASGLLFTFTMIFLNPADNAWGICFIITIVLFVPGLLGLILLPKTLPKNMNKRALATVESVRQTNVYINHLPQVELILTYQTEQGHTVTTKLREVVDYVSIGSLVPGMTLPIRYDENKPQKVAIYADDEAMAMLGGKAPANMTERCIAFVQDIQLHGNTQPDDEVVSVTFTVAFQTPRHGSIVTTIADQTTLGFLNLFPVGNPIPILYDPNNPTSAAIYYDMDEAMRAQLSDAIDQKRVRDGDLDEEMYNIAKNGIKAEGILLASSATGEVKGNRTELAVRIKVIPPQGEPYEVQMNKYFDPISLKNLFVGTHVEVYYLPSDPYKIAVGVAAS